MDLDLLVSTMNDKIDLYKKMNIQGSSVIVNQTDYIGEETIDINTNDEIKFISVLDRGLSKSRNLAIKNSEADICLFSDNDVSYKENYINHIKNGYLKYPDADIIAFTVESESSDRAMNKLKNGRVNRIMSMKISSVQISFKRKIIEEHDLYLNENFGTGSTIFNSGEENIFLYQAIKKGLKVYYVDSKIASVSFEDSTWAGKDPEKDLLTRGAAFNQMSSYLYPLYNLQFAIRKHEQYGMYPFLERLKILFKGSTMGQKLKKENQNI